MRRDDNTQDERLARAEFYDASWDRWQDMIRYSPAPRLRREKALGWLREHRPGTVLDVGCGNGELLSEVQRVLPGARLTGADISPAVVAANAARFPGMAFTVMNLDEDTAAPMERHDAVVCMEVVEHCLDPEAALGRLAALTGRVLVLSVPCGPLFALDRQVGHTRHFAPADIVPVLERAGLRVELAQRWGFPFFNLYKHAINLRPQAMAEAFLSDKPYSAGQKLLASAALAAFRLCLPWWGYQLFVVARRETSGKASAGTTK